jgi:integrase
MEGAVRRVATTAPTHANRCLAYLRSFFGWAEREGYVECNRAREVEMPRPELKRERLLSLEETLDIWRATEVLGYPFGPAIRLLILTAARREEVGGMRRQDIDFGNFAGVGAWRLRSYPTDAATNFVIALPDLARREIAAALPQMAGRWGYIFGTTGRSPPSGWSRAKRRLDVEINHRRMQAGDEPMSAWRLNDLRRSFVANVEWFVQADHEVAISCLHVQTGFRTPVNHRIAYSGCADGLRAEVLCAWARLIDDATHPEASVDRVCAQLLADLDLMPSPWMSFADLEGTDEFR